MQCRGGPIQGRVADVLGPGRAGEAARSVAFVLQIGQFCGRDSVRGRQFGRRQYGDMKDGAHEHTNPAQRERDMQGGAHIVKQAGPTRRTNASGIGEM